MSSEREEPAVSAERKPYRIWTTGCPFRKDGAPVVGTFGQTVRSVVIMDHATFRRLMAEHPTLATAQFEVGEMS